MNRIILLLIISTLLLSGVNAQDWKQYPYTPPGSAISFPMDEGRHVEEPVEWWYISGQLTGLETGFPYSFMLSYFYYPALGYDGFRILNICRDDTGEFYSDAQGLHYTELGEEGLNISARLMTDSIEWWTTSTDTSGNPVPFEYELSATAQIGDLHLSTKSRKNPLILGDSGLFNQGANSYTYYFSFTENVVNGSIRFNEISEEVSGTAWIDKQYGNFLTESEETYEWLSVNLSNGMDFVLWDLFTANNQLPDTSTYRHLSIWVDSLDQYTTHDYQLERLGYSYMPDKLMCYAQKWRLTSPTNQMDLIITTLNSHADVQLPFRFYEGATSVTGTVKGEQVTGTGFAELMKSYTPPEPALMYPRGGSWKDSLRIGWALLNPDDGRNVLYDLEYSTDGGSIYTVLTQGITSNSFHWKNPDGLSYGDSCFFRIQAYTPDHVLSGSVSSQYPSIYQPDTTSVTGAQLQTSNPDFTLYPVPANDILIVKRDYPGPFLYHIYNSAGKMMAGGEENGTASRTDISIKFLEPGIYMIVIAAEGVEPKRKQFIKL